MWQSCCGNRIALLPGIGARPRLPGIASCRAHAKVEILPSKKNVEVVGLDDNREKIFPVVLWGDNCLRRTCPAEPRQPDMEGTQLMSLTNYEAVSGFAGHWLHRAQVSLLTGEIGQIKLSHIRKKTLVRALSTERGRGLGELC